MARNISITTVEERDLLVSYLLTKNVPSFNSRSQTNNFLRKAKDMIYTDGKLFYIKNDERKELIPEFDQEKKRSILQMAHGCGHSGIVSMRNVISRSYIGIKTSEIKIFVANCDTCQRSSTISYESNITSIVPDYFRQRIMIDLIDLSLYRRDNDNYRYIFNFIETFSKFAFSFPAKDKTANTFSSILEKFLYNEGKFDIIHTDNGREFVNVQVETLCRTWGIEIIHGRPRHPQSQGQIERFNRTIKNKIKKSLTLNSHRWIDNLDKLLFEYNNSQHRATKQAPFYIYKGALNNPNNLSLQKITELNDIRNQIINYASRYVAEYNNRINQRALNIGDSVLLSRDFDMNVQTRRHLFSNLYFEDIYRITAIFEDRVSIVDNCNSLQIVHRNRLKKYNQPESNLDN